jgi:hypothetical protein
MSSPYGFDGFSDHAASSTDNQFKRKSPVHFESGPGKMSKSFKESGYMTPPQYLSILYPHIMQTYHMNKDSVIDEIKQIYYTSSSILYKDQPSTMTVQSKQHRQASRDFLLMIKIQPEDPNTSSLNWSYVYSWQGGWFTTHYKLMCLFELHASNLP